MEKLKVLLLIGNNLSYDKLSRLISTESAEYDIIGIESNLVLGIEKFRKFMPNLIVLDEKIIPISLESFLGLLEEYNRHFYVLLLSDCNDIEKYAHIFSRIPADLFDIDFLNSFVKSFISSQHIAAINDKEKKDANYFNGVRTLLEKTGLTQKTLHNLNEQYDWNLSDQFFLTIMYPIRVSKTISAIMLNQIQNVVSTIGGAIFLYNDILTLLVNKDKDSIKFPDKIVDKITAITTKDYDMEFAFLISPLCGKDSIEKHYRIMTEDYRLGYFCKGVRCMQITLQEHMELKKMTKLPTVDEEVEKLLAKLFSCGEKEFRSKLREYYKTQIKKSFSIEYASYFKLCLEMLHESCMIFAPDVISMEDRKVCEAIFSTEFRTLEEECEKFLMIFRLWSICIGGGKHNINSIVVETTLKMITHINETLSLKEMADEVNVSSPYLSSLFKKETGISFNSFYTRIRMVCAKRLLVDRELKVYRVAELCGFSDYRYFSNLFKKSENLTPTEYQKEKQRSKREIVIA